MEITLVGSGLLGTAIGERLLARGYLLHVWNRRQERAQTLVAAGGPITAEVLLNQAGTALPGRLVLQVATIAPAESCALAIALQQRGARYLETPVLGSRPEALAGCLQVMVGGELADLERARPVLMALGGEPRHLGPVGAALHAKLALNQLIASLTHSFSLALHVVQQAGVEVETFMAILRESALYAPTFDKKLAKELADDYSNPNFPTAHLRKDLQLFLTAAAALQLETQGLLGLAELLERATAAGLDELDYSSPHRLTGTTSTQRASGC